MVPDDYEACGARLSQGDVVRAPVGLFATPLELGDPSLLEHEEPLALGDLRGAALVVPRLVPAESPLLLRAWYLPAVVVSPDCDLDKGASKVLVAPLLPLAAFERGSQEAIRAGRYVSAFYLPPQSRLALADGSEFDLPPSVVELRQTTTVTPAVILAHRMFALGPGQLDRLHEAWIRFVALRELSSTGSIAAAVGKRILEVSVVASSRQRHTVLLDLEDDVHLVLYQEPRRAEPQVQAIEVKRGLFVPTRVQALAGSSLILRFENNEDRAWSISCRELGIAPHRIAAAGTSPLLIRCPEEPCEVTLVNDQKPRARLLLKIIQRPGQPL